MRGSTYLNERRASFLVIRVRYIINIANSKRDLFFRSPFSIVATNNFFYSFRFRIEWKSVATWAPVAGARCVRFSRFTDEDDGTIAAVDRDKRAKGKRELRRKSYSFRYLRAARGLLKVFHANEPSTKYKNKRFRIFLSQDSELMEARKTIEMLRKQSGEMAATAAAKDGTPAHRNDCSPSLSRRHTINTTAVDSTESEYLHRTYMAGTHRRRRYRETVRGWPQFE